MWTAIKLDRSRGLLSRPTTYRLFSYPAGGHGSGLRRAEIGGQQFTLPLRAVVRMRTGKYLSKNRSRVRMYRKFGAEAVIKFETPEPLRGRQINEQPPKP